MTLVRNSAGRKNERRVRALARFDPEKPSRTGKRSRQDAEAEFERLRERIAPQQQADGIRTKKTEADGWSEARRLRRRGRIGR